jgi:hypothetical protein
MSETIELSLTLDPTDASVPLGAEVWVSDKKIYSTEWLTESVSVVAHISDADAKHNLKIVLKNKKPEHTSIDSDGNIVKDALITVSDVQFDEIKLGHMFYELASYSHNFNDTGADVVEPFNGSMGCNGTVSLEFTSPVYLWLLENM